MNQAIVAFNNYVSQFDKSKKKVRLKIEHTFRVIDLASKMASKLAFNADDRNLILLIALLHDIGRFKQIEVQDSFKDESFDHALYGVRYLFKEGHINEYTLDTKNYALIAKAIFYHNKYVKDLPTFDEKTAIFVKLIRDIDKIDIVNTQIKEYPIYFAKREVPQSYYQDFLNEESIKTWGEKNRSKSFLTTCAFVYDLNFKESYELLQELDYFCNFFAKAEVSEDSKELYCDIKNKVYERIRKKRC